MGVGGMKNIYEIHGDTAIIIIDSPKFGVKEASISINKLERAKEFPNSWRLNWEKDSDTFYVVGTLPMKDGKREHVSLHRWVMRTPNGMVVDHFNHDGLDNTNKNLKNVTHSENIQNRKGAQKNSKSGIRGVYWNVKHNKYVAHIVNNGKQKYLGCFDDIEEAEKVVTEARVRLMPFSQEASA